MLTEFPCPVETTLSAIGGKWKTLILRHLLTNGGTLRFNELQKALSISGKVLSIQLKELEEDKLISKKIYPEIPPKVEYTVTNAGKSLIPILIAMREWGEKYKAGQIDFD